MRYAKSFAYGKRAAKTEGEGQREASPGTRIFGSVMAALRNRVEDNVIENNGVKKEVAGIGIQLEEKVGAVVLDGNKVEAAKVLEDKRKDTR